MSDPTTLAMRMLLARAEHDRPAHKLVRAEIDDELEAVIDKLCDYAVVFAHHLAGCQAGAVTRVLERAIAERLDAAEQRSS